MLTLEEQIEQLADAVDEQLTQRPTTSQHSAPPSRRWILGAAAGVLVLGVVGALAAVGGLGDNESGSASPDVSPEQVAEWRADLDAQLPTASESQQAALDDGIVTVTEILDLAQEASDCSVAAGGPLIGFEWTGEGVEWTVNTGSDDASEADRIFAITDDCWQQRVGLAEQYIGLQQVLPVEDQQRQRQLTIECLADAGFDAPDWPATDVEIDPSVEATCDDQAKALLD